MRPLRPGTDPPWVIAHRGASATLPENTVAAFEQALAEGCDGIELDVQLSRDGVPVVYHDRTLARAGGGRRRVAALDAREIAALDPGARFSPAFRGERVPMLERVLRRYAARTLLLIEIKARRADRRDGRHLALARAVADCLRSTQSVRRVVLLSYDDEALATARGRAPGLRTALNLEAPRRIGDALRRRIEPHFALSVDVRTLRAAIVRLAHDLGKPALTFTCNTPRRVTRALDCGADAIMSDRPGWLRDRLTGGRPR